MNALTLASFISILLFALISCGGGSTNGTIRTSSPLITPSPTSAPITGQIQVNQLGYPVNTRKTAVVPDVEASQFELINTADNSVALTAELSDAANWLPAGSTAFKIADFSAFNVDGRYVLRVTGLNDSHEFEIGAGVYQDLHIAAVKSYYFNRASTALDSSEAGQWARAAGHPDTSVQVFEDAASEARPAGTVLSASKGWYDAGDFGKYVVNSGITTYTLLAAYDFHSSFYTGLSWNIPESSDDIPDILNEIKWNLDWLYAMQDPADGSVYHKLTTLNFSGRIMPDQGTAQRYIIGKSTSAALNYAAVMAYASAIFEDFPTAFPGLSAQYETAAIAAYAWAENNPEIYYVQHPSVNMGEYGDGNVTDEFAWAAAELFLITQDTSYLDTFKSNTGGDSGSPSWIFVSPLGYISLLNRGEGLININDKNAFGQDIISTANTILSEYQNSSYGVPMEVNDFVWGSNSVLLNKLMILLEANKIQENAEYLDVVDDGISYLLGRNPTHTSFITGFGAETAMNIHHRASDADSVPDPIPGFVVGGPQPGQQDNCDYPSAYAALSYLDDWCSYSTNEIAINWNAPLVFVLSSMIETR